MSMMIQSGRFSGPVGYNSVDFDGTGDYLTVASNANLTLGTGDFTIEFWAYFDALGTVIIYDGRPLGVDGAYPTIYLNAGALTYYANTGLRINGGALSTGVWYHIAVSRSGTNTKMFINGTQTGSTYVDSTNYLGSTDRPWIGEGSFSLGYAVNGRISNLRVLKGTALYTANFTPPTAPLTNITNTQLLACRSTTIIDESPNAYAITAVGGAAVNSANPF